MGSTRNRRARDKNKQKLPQTPTKDIVRDDSDLEIAKELDDLYDLHANPGYPPTEVERKKK
ncbi:YfhD family protein [Salipaludibacillus daqingensis]|uniref:YfhD family protein n=1 Tax=Salipaludibacillus daqingensis TaxID=3041001 RepID=UPI0024752DED|nr:YfhD family protein [Salipaludibacillus daqingensis]